MVVRDEQSDIKAMALDILTTVSLHKLVASAVAALLSISQLDDLLGRSPPFLQHALNQLRTKLSEYVRTFPDICTRT